MVKSIDIVWIDIQRNEKGKDLEKDASGAFIVRPVRRKSDNCIRCYDAAHKYKRVGRVALNKNGYWS